MLIFTFNHFRAWRRKRLQACGQEAKSGTRTQKHRNDMKTRRSGWRFYIDRIASGHRDHSNTCRNASPGLGLRQIQSQTHRLRLTVSAKSAWTEALAGDNGTSIPGVCPSLTAELSARRIGLIIFAAFSNEFSTVKSSFARRYQHAATNWISLRGDINVSISWARRG